MKMSRAAKIDSNPLRVCTVARGILAMVAVAVALLVAAMVSYPGGTWMDPNSHGHDFIRNFLCDLAMPVALNGMPNPVGAVAVPVALFVLSAGLALFWWELPRLFGAQTALRRIV